MLVAELQELEEVKGLITRGQQLGVLTFGDIGTAVSEVDLDESDIEDYVAAGIMDRWQIEVNHREEKSHFGTGDAQVRNPRSVPRQPAFVVAVYAMLLMAAQKAYGDKRSAH